MILWISLNYVCPRIFLKPWWNYLCSYLVLVTNLNMDCPTCQACKQNTISFQLRPSFFDSEWSKHIYSTMVNAIASWHHSLGKSAISWSPNFPHNLQYITHWLIMFLIAAFAFTFQIPSLLMLFKVIPHPLCATLSWLHLTMAAVINPVFSKIIRSMSFIFVQAWFMYCHPLLDYLHDQGMVPGWINCWFFLFC